MSDPAGSPVYRFPIRCPISQAQQRLDRARRGGWLRRTITWLSHRLAQGSTLGEAPDTALEVIHLPCCWLESPMVTGAEDRHRRLAVLVDGYARTAQLVHPGNREHLESVEAPGEFRFPLAASETFEIASQAVLSARLGRRLRGTRTPLDPAKLRVVLIAEYPYLALHHTRARRRDFLLFDLFLARPAGGLARQAFLAALHHQASQRNPE